MENDREPQLGNLMKSAFRFIQSGNPSGAIEVLNRAIAIYPDDEEIYYVRGCQLRDINELSAAMDDFIETTELNPEYFEAHINAGVLAFNFNLYTKALVHFKHAVRIKPMDARATFNLGNIWLLYQKHAEKGFTCTKTHSYLGSDGTNHSKVHTYWTQKPGSDLGGQEVPQEYCLRILAPWM